MYNTPTQYRYGMQECNNFPKYYTLLTKRVSRIISSRILIIKNQKISSPNWKNQKNQNNPKESIGHRTKHMHHYIYILHQQWLAPIIFIYIDVTANDDHGYQSPRTISVIRPSLTVTKRSSDMASVWTSTACTSAPVFGST